MYINNKDFNLFHASIVSFSPTTMEIDNNIFESEEGYMPFLRNQYLKPQSRELVVDFISEEDISDLTAEISRESILDLGDSYIYKCYLKGAPSVSEEGYQSYTVSYPLYVIKQKEKEVIKNKKSFIAIGNLYADAMIEIDSPMNLDRFQVNAYVVRNLKANNTLVIDGINKLIYYKDTPDVSAFDDTNIDTFPKVYPNENRVMVSDESVDITITYYPTFM